MIAWLAEFGWWQTLLVANSFAVWGAWPAASLNSGRRRSPAAAAFAWLGWGGAVAIAFRFGFGAGVTALVVSLVVGLLAGWAARR